MCLEYVLADVSSCNSLALSPLWKPFIHYCYPPYGELGSFSFGIWHIAALRVLRQVSRFTFREVSPGFGLLNHSVCASTT